jgi:hypothetical protein
MLIGAHASGDAVHDDADAMFFHKWRRLVFQDAGGMSWVFAN